MTCPQETELALFASGEGRDRRISRLDRHVRSCARCAQAVSEFQVVRSAVATSGSQMLPSARQQVRTEILDRISREPLGRAGKHPLLPVLRIACVLVVLSGSVGLVRTLHPPQAGELPLEAAFKVHRPPARAFVFSEPRVTRAEATIRSLDRFEASGKLETVQLALVVASDGPERIAQLRIPAKNSSLEIHWIME